MPSNLQYTSKGDELIASETSIKISGQNEWREQITIIYNVLKIKNIPE